MKKFDEVLLNEYGYYELEHPLKPEEIRRIFEEEYFQNSMSNYEQLYDEDELKFFENKMMQKELMLKPHLPQRDKLSFLDIGCGEGFALDYFHKNGYQVTGIDFSVYGTKKHHPDMLPYLLQGDSKEILPKLIAEKRQFDIINMDSVLDMMVNPEEVLALIGKLLTEDGVLLIKVANQFNPLQTRLLEKNKLKEVYWLDKVGHPSYFNKDGLIRFVESFGFACTDLLGESYIEFFLANDDTNYYENKSSGKNCYRAKLELENLMHEISPEKSIDVFRALGKMGLGREVIGIFKKNS